MIVSDLLDDNNDDSTTMKLAFIQRNGLGYSACLNALLIPPPPSSSLLLYVLMAQWKNVHGLKSF